MSVRNVYMIGVGGQGIGLLSEILMRAVDAAGFAFKAVDTHGLAQRGGIVESQLRVGPAAHTPLIPTHEADLVVALERHEALRGLLRMARPGGALVYYDTVWQPLDVRLEQAEEVNAESVAIECGRLGVRLVRVFEPTLSDARMQNIAVLTAINRHRLIDGVATEHYRQAMTDLMAGGMLERNMALFDTLRAA